VGDKEILETYFNSASKNTSATDISPQGRKSLLTSVIDAVEVYWILSSPPYPQHLFNPPSLMHSG